MAINPMQKRARNSFIQGALITLILMLVVVLFLVKQMRALNDAKEALEKANSKVYVALDDLKSGEEIKFEEDFMMETVRTKVDKSEIISQDDFMFKNEKGEPVEKYKENDGTPIYPTIRMKIDVPAGTIVTKEMIYSEDDETEDSERIQEYNMILLPSNLRNGEHVDIRLTLPTGQDYVVLAKKEVLGTTDTGLWLEVTESEILTMNNAIIESYIIPGTKLYASQYTEAGMQNKSTPTYQVSGKVKELIERDPNISPEARSAILDNYNGELRTLHFEEILYNYVSEPEDRDNAVQQAFNEEIQKIQEDRAAFVEELEGTDEIGFNQGK